MSAFQSSINIHTPPAGRRFGGWRMGLLICLAGIVVIPFGGCNYARYADLFEQPVIDYRDEVWARRAYNLRFASCERPYEKHFQQGFIDGYCSVCNGEDGYVPALPPEEYWGYEYQSADGSQCVNSWFKGFPLGAAAARRDGAGSFRDVYISKMANSAIEREQKDPPGISTAEPTPSAPSTPPPSPGVRPELRIDTPDQPASVPVGTRETSLIEREKFRLSRLEPVAPPIDPHVQMAGTVPVHEPNLVRTAMGTEPHETR